MTARELALHVLEQRFGPVRSGSPRDPLLASFQQEAQERLLAAIRSRGGALLADSVGLGKTFVAAAVARSLARPGSTIVAVVPTSLLRLWRQALQHVAGVRLVTHATLSRGGPSAGLAPALVLVDEAHAFRNPRTRRYTALARLAAGRPLLLLTATPVNNSVWDLYWLLRLFARDDAFADLGVAHLASCFERAHRTGRPDRIPAVLAVVAVRRSRALVAELHGTVTVGERVLRFPRRTAPLPVRYGLPDCLRSMLAKGFEDLELRPWRDFGPVTGFWLLRLVLLKRLESSAAALRGSLYRLYRTLQAFEDALDRGLLLSPAVRARADPAQLRLDALLLRPLPPQLDAGDLRQSARRDLARLQEYLAQVAAGLAADPKLHALLGTLEELRGRPVLLFTEFRETAEYLWQSLRGRYHCGLIHGNGAWLGAAPAARRAVIERFAPRANGVPPPAARERVDLLIATDVLAEGLNLQDAADVISYDLPWNPVRVVQRLGRIDRLGSLHELIRSWYFVPHRELDRLLGLVQRLRCKLRAISTTVGAEAPVLAPAPRAIARIAVGDTSPFRRAERLREGMFDIEERLRAAFRRELQHSDDALAGLPLAAARSSAVAAGPRPRRKSRSPAETLRAPPAVQLAVPPALLPRGPRRQPATALVFLQAGTAQRAVFVGPHSCREDDLAAGEILLHLLRQPAPDPNRAESGCGMPEAAPEAALEAARRASQWVQRPPARARASPACDRRVRARVLRLLQEVPGGPTDEDCRRAELVLRELARGVPAPAEISLRAIARDRSASLAEVLDRLEEALCHATRTAPISPSAPAERAGPPPTVIAVFLLATGG